MCYSAQINAEYQKLVRRFGATMSLEDFTRLYMHDEGKKRPRTPKAMDDAFGQGTSPAERAIAAAVGQWSMTEIQILEQEIFAQRRRLADAERALQVKPTKMAKNELGVAGRRIDRALAKLASLKCSQPEAGDSLRPGDRLRRRTAGRQAHALPVPPGGQACQLRPALPVTSG